MRTLPFILLSVPGLMLAQQGDVMFHTQVMQAGDFSGNPATIAFVSGELVGGPSVTGAPYSADAVTETTQVLADGNRIVNKNTSKIYRDSAGRERREQSLPRIGAYTPDNNGPTTVMISDPVLKVNYTLELNSKHATKMPGPSLLPLAAERAELKKVFTQSSTAFAGPAGGRVMVYSTGAGPGDTHNSFKTDDLGVKIIDGVSAQGTRTTITIPAGQVGNERAIEVVSESWYSPELKVVMMTRHSDPRSGEAVYQLTNVIRSEPLPSLFEIPPDFQVTDMKALQRVERIQK